MLFDEHLYQIGGCIAGLALGDAFGMPGQPTPETTLERNGGPITKLLPPPPGDVTGHTGLKAGQATDDTTAMLAIVEAIIEHKAVTQEIVAEAIIDWVESLGGLDTPYIGPSTKRAVKALKDGASTTESGKYGWTNGAAMRVAPIGFIHQNNLDATVKTAVDSAYPTHATATACGGAAAVACAVNRIAAEQDLERASVDSIMEAAMYGADAGEALGLERVAPRLSRRIEFAIDLVSNDRPIQERQRDLYDLVGTGMGTYESVPSALALFYMANGDPYATLKLCANIGGDTDTMAAIAGALCGTLHGYHELPQDMVKTVEEVNGYDFIDVAQRYRKALREMARS